ncbi:MAG: pseudouridine-5'-phosphate glycosidase [Phycisphaerales bacterium]|nr:MAG: pseudouridine-5'-phosphate glycosidase [Phycisphaerales bacterium]
MNPIKLHPEIEAALREGKPVVALETAVLTAGLPRTPHPSPDGVESPEWRADQPVNLEAVRLMQWQVRAAGAVPAIIAVIRGELRIGVNDEELDALARDESAGKVSPSGLAAAMSHYETAGTTVAATLIGCLAPCRRTEDPLPPIRVFATGGIGGVHRGWSVYPDISADLIELARSPVCVVCAGAKSILDLPATLEALETLSVPVLGLGTSWFPQFFTAGGPGLPVGCELATPQEAADLCRTHWQTLGRREGVLLTQPVPAEAAMDAIELDALIESAEWAATAAGISGPARTPFLLETLAIQTEGRTLRANLSLLAANARAAGEVAVALADRASTGPFRPGEILPND